MGREQELAGRLLEVKETVLSLWEARARRTLPAPHLDRLMLLDGIPSLIEELADELSHGAPAGASPWQSSENATGHGRQRAGLRIFSMDEVIAEYELLRQVVFDVVERAGGPLPRESRDALLNALEARIRSSASEFARVRESELQQARDEAEKAKASLEEKVRERTAELTITEARFRGLVEGVKDYAIFTLDPKGNVTSWNAGAERMIGYTAREILGNHFSVLYPEDSHSRGEPMAHLRAAALEGRFRGEAVRVRRNREHFLADVLITPMYDGAELIGFSKVVQDLTERNTLIQERDLLRSDADLLRVEAEYRKRFMATLSHDLRNPLSVARMAAAIIERAPEQTAEVRRGATRIAKAIDRADRMIVDLLDAARLDAGQRLTLDLAKCSLPAIAEDVRRDFTTRHGERFVVETSGEAEGFWNADGLRRILENLLNNAVKYGEAGAPITLKIRRVANRVLVTVHNQGRIIPVTEQAKLFQPYHRTDDAESSGQRGWGLGLMLVRGIVAAHNGSVKVESYPTVGTTFTLDLPIDPRISKVES